MSCVSVSVLEHEVVPISGCCNYSNPAYDKTCRGTAAVVCFTCKKLFCHACAKEHRDEQ
jgi:hypothetical protein